jgi:hypothetical protein
MPKEVGMYQFSVEECNKLPINKLYLGYLVSRLGGSDAEAAAKEFLQKTDSTNTKPMVDYIAGKMTKGRVAVLYKNPDGSFWDMYGYGNCVHDGVNYLKPLSDFYSPGTFRFRKGTCVKNPYEPREDGITFAPDSKEGLEKYDKFVTEELINRCMGA